MRSSADDAQRWAGITKQISLVISTAREQAKPFQDDCTIIVQNSTIISAGVTPGIITEKIQRCTQLYTFPKLKAIIEHQQAPAATGIGVVICGGTVTASVPCSGHTPEAAG